MISYICVADRPISHTPVNKKEGGAHGRLSATAVEDDGIRPTKAASVTNTVELWTVSLRQLSHHRDGGETVYK